MQFLSHSWATLYFCYAFELCALALTDSIRALAILYCYTSATKWRKAQAHNGWATDGRDPQNHIRTHTIVDTHQSHYSCGVSFFKPFICQLVHNEQGWTEKKL